MPSISPLSAGQPLYTVTAARAFVADLMLDAGSFEEHFVNVSFPSAAAGLALELVQAGPPAHTVSLTTASGSDTSVPGRTVAWDAS